MFTLGVIDFNNLKTNLVLTVSAFKVAVLVSEGQIYSQKWKYITIVIIGCVTWCIMHE